MFDIVGIEVCYACVVIYMFGGGGWGEDIFIIIIIIKMASVFKLPDVNVYVCVWGGGGGWDEITYLLY